MVCSEPSEHVKDVVDPRMFLFSAEAGVVVGGQLVVASCNVVVVSGLIS